MTGTAFMVSTVLDVLNMRRNDQVGNVVALLRKKPASRQAVINCLTLPILRSSTRGFRCTCTFQFM